MSDEELSPEELSALLSSYMPEIPGYRVMRRIGKGGMSQVYLGVQESLDRQVAVKVMSPEALRDEKTKQRFEHEARTIAKLEHPCIVGIHEVGRTPQGLMYYVLPYLAKGHLGQRDFRNDEPRIVEVLRALLSALEYAHARGIVHRDVKAENVLYDNADRPLLTDFGIALSKRDSTRITTAGLAVGSGGYMAPEQARGEAVDGRADLYSVGVLAFELLTGHLPFASSDPLGLALMHAQDPIPRLPAEKRRWQAFIDRAMAKLPENRYRNAQQMLSALEQIPTGENAPVTPERAPWKMPSLRDPPAWIGPGMVVLAVALLAFGALSWRQRQAATTAKAPDFFTATQDKPSAATAAAPSAVAAPVVPAPAPAASTSSALATPASATVAAAPPPPPAAAPTTTAAPASSPFAHVVALAVVTPLDYDPTQPGAKAVSAAKRQLAKDRLSTPPGDNAAESLLAARQQAPNNPDVAALSEQLIGRFGARLVKAIQDGKDDDASTTYKRVEKFAKDSGRNTGNAWKALRASLAAPLMTRLDAANSRADGMAIVRTKALAGSLAVVQQDLEPAWSKAIVLPKPGDALAGDGPAMVLVSVPTGERSGLAAMREEVSRNDYSSFANSSHRAAAPCNNRFEAFFGSKRSWEKPGFDQSGNHPVVCVTYEDAKAYAVWLSNRTGAHYRLPSASEWRSLASYRAGEPCRAGQIACGSRGTAPGSSDPASPLGLHDLLGNVSEWLLDSGSAGKQLTAGLSWRDRPGAAPTQTAPQQANRGYDDVGFRLVREVSTQDLGRR